MHYGYFRPAPTLNVKACRDQEVSELQCFVKMATCSPNQFRALAYVDDGDREGNNSNDYVPFGAFLFGARQFGACHFGAIPVWCVSLWRAAVWRVPVWRDSSSARFTLGRFTLALFPFCVYVDPVQ